MKNKKQPSPLFFNACFDKGQLKNLVAWFLESYGEKITVDFLETLKQVGFNQATRAGVSLGLDDLQIPTQKSTLISQAIADVQSLEQNSMAGNITSVEKSQRMIDTWNQTSELLRQNAVQNFRNTNPVNPVYMMAFSGARGNISQVRQLVAMRGLMADPQGAILEFPIQSNFREGLTLTEYLISCYGARKGLVDTALRTATSGYLTRRLVDAVQHVVVSMVDCGTEKSILLNHFNLESRLIGRVLAQNLDLPENNFLVRNQLISPTLAKLIAKKYTQVFVRSPLTCEAYKAVCQMCYGWNLANGNLVSIGEAVGVIAAQSIGEPGTQLTMRTFHTGGVGVFSDQAMKAINASFNGIVEFSETLTGHFVRTPHGQIVYMLKYTNLNPNRILLKVINIENPSLLFSITEKELPPGSLLLVRQGEKVKVGQLLAQSSQIKTSKQQMPETTHPVQSTIDGEVYFESMLISKQKQLPIGSKRRKTKEDEIGPDIRTLIELGSFWVFAGQSQREFHIAKPIVHQGDLVSTSTTIFQYNFHVPQQAQLKIVKSQLAFGQSGAQIPLAKIRFNKFGYSLSLSSRQKKQPNAENHILFYTKNPKDSQQTQSLIWYPAGWSFKEPGYFWFFNNYYEHKNEILNENPALDHFSDIPSVKKRSFFAKPRGSFFYSPQSFVKITDVSPLFYVKLILLLPNILFRNGNKTSVLNSKIRPASYIFNNCLDKATKEGFFQLTSSLPKNQGEPEFKFGQAQIRTKKSLKFHLNVVSSSVLKTTFLREEEKSQRTMTPFLLQGLKQLKDRIYEFKKNPSLIFQHKKGWLYIPSVKISKDLAISAKSQPFLEKGHLFTDILFPNSPVSLEFIGKNKIKLLKSKKQFTYHKKPKKVFWYSLDEILQTKPYLSLKQGFRDKNFVFKNDSNLHLLTQSKEKKVSAPSFAKSSYFFAKRIIFHKFDIHWHKKRDETITETRLICNLIPSLTKIQNFILDEKQEVFTTSTKKTTPFKFFLIKPLKETNLPTQLLLTKQWVNVLNQKKLFKTNSPFFSKQYCTDFSKKTSPNIVFQLKSPEKSGWFSPNQILRINVTIESSARFKQVTTNFIFSSFVQNQSIACIGFRFFLYDLLLLKNSEKFNFEAFKDGWVLPNKSLTTGFVKLKSNGEFRRLKSTQSESVTSIMRNPDVITFQLPQQVNSIFSEKLALSDGLSLKQSFRDKNFVFKMESNLNNKNLTETNITDHTKVLQNKEIQVGDLIRWGQEICPGFGSAYSGQILKITDKEIRLRHGISILASARGIIHVFHNDLIQKNDLLVTLKSRRLQTEDIVQGIPKIEQLFEARETKGGEIIANSVHTKLQNFFVDALKSGNLALAVPESVQQIQVFLVENILEAYLNQGVKISEKHVEVVVRQMTTRVRILAGGDTGLLPGELVQLTWIQELNKQLKILGNRQATYEPIILGITKSVLQSESFLLAASFQEVSRVLVRSALSRKTDFLRGLHENVILGQLVPAGTGLLVDNRDEIVKKSISSVKLNP